MKKLSQERICQAYLRKTPIAHSLSRILECFVLQEFHLRSPILDLGCSDGVFAQICLGKGKVDVGLDADPRVAELAEKSGAYKKVVVAKAEKMPFKDSFFNTVISNSVLEHIEDLDSVFQETHRVLKKEGRFIFLVPDKTASDYFFYAWFLEKIRLKGLANSYTNLKNKIYRYAHLEKKDFWEKIAKKHGFKIRKVVGLISPQTVKVMDFFTPFALPDYLLRKVFGRSFVFRPDFLNQAISLYLIRKQKPVKETEATAWYLELEK
jgi:SAM-dependent methyltransferase